MKLRFKKQASSTLEGIISITRNKTGFQERLVGLAAMAVFQLGLPFTVFEKPAMTEFQVALWRYGCESTALRLS